MRKDEITIGILLMATAALLVFGARAGIYAGALLRVSVAPPYENDELQKRVAVLESERAARKALEGASRTLQNVPEFIPAVVYSRYPFNFKDEIYISGGTNRAMRAGDSAVADGIFVGRVEEVFQIGRAHV